jgi:hypothetical protein
MFRFSLPILDSIKKQVLKKLVQRNNKTSPTAGIEEPIVGGPRVCNPWQDDLDKLVCDTLKRRDTRLEHDQAVQRGLPIDELMVEEKPAETEKPAEPTRRVMDGTVTDVKAWWGDALAPWTDHTRKARQENPDGKTHRRWFR